MSETLEIGDKVKYHTGDERWENGVVHGIRKMDVEDKPEIISYLVDTGKDHRLDVHQHSLRDEMFQAEKLKHRKAGLDHIEAHKRATKAIEKIPEEVVETTERQPEQVDVRPDCIKGR